MAKANSKSADAVAMERNRVGLEKLRIVEQEKTKRIAILCFFVTVVIGIISWAIVRMTDKPPWLVLGLAVLAALSGPSLILVRAVIRLRREVDFRVSNSLTNRLIDPNRGGNPPGPTHPEGEESS